MSILRVPLDPPPPDEGVRSEPLEEVVSIGRRELEELRARAAATLDPQGDDRPATSTTAIAPAAMSKDLDPPTARDERTIGLERAYRQALLERELATVLAGKPIVAGAVAQLIKLWRDDLDVYEDEGTIKVASRDGRSVSEAVAEWLDRPEYSHFRPASSRGGTGSLGMGPRSGSSTPAQPRSLGDAILNQWREAKSKPADPQGGLPGWGRRR